MQPRLSKSHSAAMTLVEVKKAGVPVFAYGSFLTVVVNFLIVAFVLFLAVRAMNTLKKAEAAAPSAPPPPPRSEVLLQEIRDALVNK